MGLQKTETQHGIAVDYWVITSFPSDMIGRNGYITLRGYATRADYKDAPNEGNPRWANYRFFIPREDFDPLYKAALDPTYPANLHEMLYAYVTADASVLPPRADGTDVTGIEDSPFIAAAPVHEDTN
mgnify:CR=1 FL=1